MEPEGWVGLALAPEQVPGVSQWDQHRQARQPRRWHCSPHPLPLCTWRLAPKTQDEFERARCRAWRTARQAGTRRRDATHVPRKTGGARGQHSVLPAQAHHTGWHVPWESVRVVVRGCC